MTFVPMELMLNRVRRARSDSDTALFHELLYVGEFIVKLTTAAFVASIEDDRESHRYRLVHTLVRADGVGEWARALEEALTGTASQHIAEKAKGDRRVFNERLGPEAWQYEATEGLWRVLRAINSPIQPLAAKVELLSWFTMFAELRNKTRGHGAPTAALCARLCPQLNASIKLVCDRNPIFVRPWAYLHRNLSGKYLVVPLGGDEATFSPLTSAGAKSGEHYTDGLYIFWSQPRLVELVRTDLNVSDFYFPNGAFNGKRFELHSLITDSRIDGDAAPYVQAASPRPPSETQGRGALEILGNVFTNLPAVPNAYVRRSRLEGEVVEAITDDRHPIVTLVGRGGIGKTSLALRTLHEVATTSRYDVIVWFSARDIDLSLSGPKIVQPQVLTEKDIADEFVSLVGGSVVGKSKTENVKVMAESLRASQFGGPILFVFDNFETVRSPVDLFQWIDTNIRLPNKAVITSRFRDFKADYPIDISGMERAESDELISRTANLLGIQGLLTKKLREDVIEQSDGHPYVIKIMLGELSDAKGQGKPERLIARKDDILDALFERTFANLSPLASRIFLTLCGWRSLVPQLALEAVLLRSQSEHIDPSSAVDELLRMSLVQRTTAQDQTDFLDTPLTAAIFGVRKLRVSPIRMIIESDISLLQDLGPTASTSLKEGLRPRIETLFRKVAARIGSGTTSLASMLGILEFIARSYPPAWLLLADLTREVEGERGIARTIEYIRRFLEREPKGIESDQAWQRLASLYRLTRDVIGACGAFLEAAATRGAPLDQISNMANWLNTERENFASMDVADRVALFGSMAGLMERHLKEASATDLSRLAWLHLHSGHDTRALEVAEMGLRREPNNSHCRRLVDKLRGYG
jgi:hypothetical protein